MLIIPDLHIGLVWDGLDRTEDIFAALDSLAKHKGSEPVMFLGDIFESSNVSHSYVARFIDFLAKNFEQEVFILAGNHDGQPDHRKGSPLEEVAASGHAKVLWMPQFVKGVGFCIPYAFYDIAEDQVPDGCDVFTHIDIPNVIPGMEVHIGRGLPIVMPDWLPKKVHRVFAGHIHKPQQLGNICIVGSLISTDLSEVGEVKRAVVTKPNTSDFDIVPIDNRPLMGIDVVYGTEKYTKAVEALFASLQLSANAIVSAKIMCPHTKAHEVDWIKQEDILRSMCYYLRWTLNIVKEKEVRAKDLDLTKTDGEIIKDFVNKQDVSDKAEVLKCFEEILT